MFALSHSQKAREIFSPAHRTSQVIDYICDQDMKWEDR